MTEIGMISFSEATRFTPEKHEQAKVWCTNYGRPLAKHLLYPRTKGFVTTVQHLRQAKHIQVVYDVTIAYQHGDDFMVAPNMLQTLILGKLSKRHKYRFHVHVRRFELIWLPENELDLAEWLERRWLAKGDWLAEQKGRWAKAEKQS